MTPPASTRISAHSNKPGGRDLARKKVLEAPGDQRLGAGLRRTAGTGRRPSNAAEGRSAAAVSRTLPIPASPAPASAMPFDDETIAKLEKKLIAAGYTDGEWRSIMFKYYGEDYEGMPERAKLRAEERERRKVTMDISKETSVLPSHGASKLDPAAVGGTQAMLERGLIDYFPVPSISKGDRKLRFGLTSSTEHIAQTIGTGAPGKGGINSQGVMTLLREKSPEAEGEEQAEAEPAAAEGDGAEGAEGAEGEGAAVQPPAQEEEVVDEDELMFIWNKREAPHYRRGKVDAALEERLQETIEIEETLKKRLEEQSEKDAAWWSTVGVSKDHPQGTLANGQWSQFLPKPEQKPSAGTMEGQFQTARWSLELDSEALQPDERKALLSLPNADYDNSLTAAYEHKGMIFTTNDVAEAEANLLRDTLGPSKMEMPPDVDPHYMNTTFFKTAHSMNAATQEGRPDEEYMAAMGTETQKVLEGLREETQGRIGKVQEKLKKLVIKDAGEKLDIPAILLRKFNYLQNPRYKGLPQDFRGMLNSLSDGTLQAPDIDVITKDRGIGANTIMGDPVFVAKPAVVQFTDYEVGQVYELPLRLQNSSGILRRLRVLPPASEHFSVSLVKYLGEDGLVAPGMYCMVSVRFLPDTLADYEDTLYVVTEQGMMAIPLLARRLPPNLTIPHTIDVGNCYVNDLRSIIVPCKNQGGRGRFLLVPDYEWPEPPDDVHQRDHVYMSPFKIQPAHWALEMGDSIDVKVDFAPGAEGRFQVGFRLVCDNCSVQEYSIIGVGLVPSLKLLRLDGEQIVPPLADVLRPNVDQAFADLAPGAVTTRLVQLKNRTELPIEFHWNVEHHPTPHTEQSAYLSKWGRLGETHSVFSVSPATGTFQANEEIEFRISFSPVDIAAFRGAAVLVAHTLPSATRAPPDDPNAMHVEGMGAGGFAYEDEEMSRFTLVGAGSECQATIEPMVLVVSQRLSVGRTYTKTIKVANKSDASTVLSFEKYPELLYQAVKVVPDKVTLAAREERELRVEIAPRLVAPLEVSLMCQVLHGAARSLSVLAEVDGPKMQIVDPQLDFGLMRCGWKVKRQVTLRNTCDVTARYKLSLVAVETGEAWGSTMSVTPSKGLLDSEKSITVTVEFSPTEPQRTRCTMVLEVDGGITQYMRIRAEVVNAQVCLSTNVVDLGTIFLAVPVSRTIKLRNLTLLPSTQYKWDVQSANALRTAKSSAFRLDVLAPEGALGPDEEVDVEVHVEALDLGEAVGEQTTRSEQLGSAANPGVLRALVPIDVDGMPLPTGFELRANVMGLAVTYHVGTIDSLEPVPAHMKGTPAALKVGIKTDWSKWLLGPDVDAPICLDFGQKPAMQKHSMTFVIRNHTGIDSSYNLHFEEFGVAEHEVLMLNYAAAVEAAAQASRESRTSNKSPSRRQHTPPRSERSGAQSPKAKLASTSMMTTQSGFSVGSVEPRPSHKATKQTGTIATVRMGATMERAVATGAAGRVLTQAEGVVRKNRSMAPLLQDAEKQLGLGLRKGHAATQLKRFSKMHEENSRMKSTSLWSLPGDHSSVASRGHSAGGYKAGQLILSDEHEEVERFRSYHGQQMLNARNAAQEAQQMLEEGKGVAMTCASYAGPIPAWGEVELRVDLYSDMCGVFRDRLIVDVVGLPRVHIPVVAKLTGTPVALEGGTLGLNMMGGVPSLDFGDILQNNIMQNRAVRVSNSAPWPIAVNWKILESAPPQGSNLLQLTSSVDADGQVHYSVVAVEPEEASNPPYKLDPERLVIPAHSTKAVNISCEWDTPSHHENFLTGSVEVLPKDAPMPGEEGPNDKGRVVEPLELLDREEAQTALLQDVATGAQLINMEDLVVGLRCEVTSAFLETDCNKHLKWICSTSTDYRTHPSWVKEVALSNRSRCNLTFTLKVDQPFSIDSTVCTAPIHPMAMPADTDPSAQTVSQKMFTLPPNDCVVVRIRFTPPSKHRSGRVVDDVLLFGEITMTFTNEEVQKLPLEAHLRHPQLDILPEELNFSTLHVESTASVPITLTNPTYADATWKIVHAPKNLGLTMRSSTAKSSEMAGTGGRGSSSAIALPSQDEPVYEDDGGVFSFEPSSGVIKGNAKRPTILETKIVTVRFNPKKNVDYKSRFKVEIEGGRGGFIQLTGTGSYEENMEPGGATGVIRDHPGFHPAHLGVRGPVIPNEHLHSAEPNKEKLPVPMVLPAWYDMDKAMEPRHLTKYTQHTAKDRTVDNGTLNTRNGTLAPPRIP